MLLRVSKPLLFPLAVYIELDGCETLSQVLVSSCENSDTYTLVKDCLHITIGTITEVHQYQPTTTLQVTTESHPKHLNNVQSSHYYYY